MMELSRQLFMSKASCGHAVCRSPRALRPFVNGSLFTIAPKFSRHNPSIEFKDCAEPFWGVVYAPAFLVCGLRSINHGRWHDDVPESRRRH